jgi:hypothetical protein
MAFPPRLMDHILPPNGTEYERTLASQVNQLLDISVPIRDLWNPWTCPENLLPYLAWSLSVDLWDPKWPITKRRSVVANAIKHHRLKGTLAGTETYVELVDSKVVRAITPPAKIFSGPSLSREQREDWLQSLPQIRVWRQYERSVAGKRIFSGGANYSSFLSAPPDVDHPDGYKGRRFPHENDAITRLRRRARWVVNGVETDSRVENFESYFRVFLKGTLKHSTFSKAIISNGRFFVPSTAFQRVVTIEPLSLSPWRNSVGPRLTPVTSEPEIVAQHGSEGHAVYSGRTFGGRFFVPSKAAYRLFERYAVHDRNLVGKRPSIQFMGVGRYGIPGHTAELKIRMREKVPKWKAREGIIPPKTRFWMPHDHRLMERNRQAINASKRRTDTIWIDTTTAPGFIAGLPFFAGDTFTA